MGSRLLTDDRIDREGDQMRDEELLTAIRHVVDRFDPMPQHLASGALAVVEAYRVVDFALLVAVGDPMACTRGDETRTVEFADTHQQVVVRIGAADTDQVRVDGWMTPIRPGRVVVRVGERDFCSDVAVTGRFQIDHLPHGRASAWFEPDHPCASALGWRTPDFEL